MALFLMPFYSSGQNSKPVYSYLQTVNIDSKEISVVYEDASHFEAPNWSTDGKYLIYNSGGSLFKLYLQDASIEEIKLDKNIDCNNDHGISADGTRLVISGVPILPDQEPDGSTIYITSIDGGAVKQITTNAPSYWHGWSPDGNTLAFVGLRNNEYDIYTISADGGDEKRITSSPGLDDGPDYSPDGEFIYCNTIKSGVMELWRMDPDGKNPVQLTNDAFSNWFPHPSPDGKYLVFMSYIEDQKEAHPFGRDVKLRLYNLQSKEISDLTEVFYGGQGTINVPSWAPDSRNIAFVRYQRQD